MASALHTRRHRATITAAAACLALCAACSVEPCRVAMADVDSGSWDETVTVSYENADTASLYDLSVVLHVVPSFRAEQIALSIEILSPDSMRLTEDVTLATTAADAPPTSYGKDMEAPYRRSVRLKGKGCYTISLTPREPVAGVEAAVVTFQPVTQ